MEQRTLETAGDPGKTSLLMNGSANENILPPKEDVHSLDDRVSVQKDIVLNQPITEQNKETALPLSNQKHPLIKEDTGLEENLNSNLPVKTDRVLNVDGDTILKPFSNSDSGSQRGIPQQTPKRSEMDQPVLDMISNGCLNSTATNSPQSPRAAGLEQNSTAIFQQPSGLHHQSDSTSQSPKLEPELSQPNNLDGAIDAKETEACVVEDGIKPKIHPHGDVTPTAPDLAESKSSAESTDTTVKIHTDVKTENVQSKLSSESQNPESCSQSSKKEDDVGDIKHPSGEQSQSSDPQASENPLGSSSSQKTPSKSRSNTLIFIPDLSDELLQGYRILTEIFSDKCKSFVWPFLDAVDTEALWDYEIKVKHPMWLRKIEFKFLNKEYQNLTEFAVDMRQMLENCYRYNGMKHQISKYAQTLECVFEQKLALLSRPLQEKTTLYVTSDGKYKDGCPDRVELSSGRLRRSCTRLAVRALEQASASPLAFHIRHELEQQEREEKRQKIVDRRDEIIKERQDLMGWDKQMIGETNWTYMKSLWEIPAIGHFLCLCQTVLELDEISFYELERSFAIPLESVILCRIFTTLLSTPYQRTRLGKKPPMPYKVWEARLREWVRGWYHVLDKLVDPLKVYEKIGVPERFFEVLGPRFQLDKLQYHELTYYERVWVMKALCDQLFETQLPIRRCLLSQPIEDQRPIILGVDGDTNSYIHFPQFCGADLRVYRQAKYPDLYAKTKRAKAKEKESENTDTKNDAPPPPCKARKTPVTRKTNAKSKQVAMDTPRSRPSRLRQRLTPTIHFGTYAESLVSGTESEDAPSEITEMDDQDESDSQSSFPKTLDKSRTLESVEDDEDSRMSTESSGLQVLEKTEENADEDSLAASGEEKHKPSNETFTSSAEEQRSQLPNDTGDENHKKPHMPGDQKHQQTHMTGDQNHQQTHMTGDKIHQQPHMTGDENPQQSHMTGDQNHQQTHMTGDEKPQQPDNDVKSDTDHISGETTDSKAKSKTEQLCNGDMLSRSSSTSDISKLSSDIKIESKVCEDGKDTPDPRTDSGRSSPSIEHSTVQDHPIQSKGESESDGNAIPESQNTNNNSSQTASAPSGLEPTVTPDDKPSEPTPAEAKASETFEPHVEVLPVLGEFELVCDSMDSLRELVERFAPPESKPPPPTTGRRRKAAAQVRQPLRKRCEKDLHEKLTNLLLELTPWEAKLAKFAMRNREKFKKEYETSKMAPQSDQDIRDIWASEESSSESEASEAESEGEDVSVKEEEDEEWNATCAGRRLRKRKKKQLNPLGQEDEEDLESVNDEASEAPKKPKRPKSSSRSKDSKKSPPHKNQLNTSLLDLFKKLPDDGLKEASRRLQTMIKRGEAARNHKLSKSKLKSSTLSEGEDGQAVIALLNKTFWVAAKPPAVEGIIAQSVEELITTYPIFVQNLLFRNLKNGLNKISEAHKSSLKQEDGANNQGDASEPKEVTPIKAEPSEEVSTREVDGQSANGQTADGQSMDGQSAPNSTSNKIKTRFSLSNTPKEGVQKLGTKTKEVMDDIVLQGLYITLATTKRILRERLAIGLSELLPDYSNLQESLVKKDSKAEKQEDKSQSCAVSAKKETDKDLLLKMLPKPSQYLKNPKMTSEVYVAPGLKYPSNTTSTCNTTRPTNSILVSVPTSKLHATPKSQLKREPVKGPLPAQTQHQVQPSLTASTISTSQPTGDPASVPHGVYTIKVDANVWTQLQGKPDLQQQFVLQQIKEMQQKQAESGQASTAPQSGTNNPAHAVTCIRSPTKTTATTQKNAAQSASPKSRLPQVKNMPNVSDLSSLQPVKVLKQTKPKSVKKARVGFGEAASNLSQKELIALLQQQQRQLELHRQQQQQKLQSRKTEEQQGAQQQQQQQQQTKQQFVLSASGALGPQAQPKQATGVQVSTSQVTHVPPSTLLPNASSSYSVIQSSNQPTILSTKTFVTSSLRQPKMAVNSTVPKPGTLASPTTTVQASSIHQQPRTQTIVPCSPTQATTSSNTQGTRLHLVQTSKGNQFILHTGSGQAPRLVSLSSGVNQGNNLPVVLDGQTAQLVKQVSQATTAPVASIGAAAGSLPNQQIKLVMQPHQTNDASSSLPQGLLQLGQQVQAVQVKLPQGSATQLPGQPAQLTCIPNAPQSAKQPESQISQQAQPGVVMASGPKSSGLTSPPPKQASTLLSPSQLVHLQNQRSPTGVSQKPQIILKGYGDSKIVVGNPAKVVRLVHPSHLSTAATFVPTSEDRHTSKSKGLAVNTQKLSSPPLQGVNQPVVSQQLVGLPGKIGSVVAAQIAAPQASTTTTSSNNIQEHLQQVILQQLASGKLKLSPQTAPVSNVGPNSSQQQAPLGQLNVSNLIKTLPVVMSQQVPQQVPQLVTQIQQSVPASNPVTEIKAAQYLHQTPTNVLQTVKVLNPQQTVQTSALRTIVTNNVANQAHRTGQAPQGPQQANSTIQLPTVVVNPGQVVIPASHLVQGQQLLTNSAVNQGLITQVATLANPALNKASNQQILAPQQQVLGSQQQVLSSLQQVLASQQQQVPSPQQQVLVSQQQVPASQQQVLVSQQQQLAAPQQQVLVSQQQVPAPQQQVLASQQQQVPAPQQQVLVSQQQVPASQQQLLASHQQVLASQQQQLPSPQQQLLVSQQQQVPAPQHQVLVSQQQVPASQQQVMVSQQQVPAPQQQVLASLQQLSAPQQQVLVSQSTEPAPQQQLLALQQQGIKRPSPMLNPDATIAKIPRLTAPDQLPPAPTSTMTSVTGLNSFTSQSL